MSAPKKPKTPTLSDASLNPPADALALAPESFWDRSGSSETVPFAAAEPPEAGELVGGYRIVSELGRGGRGVVYLARDLRLGRNVALKMVLAGGHAGDDALLRFRSEAEAVARVQHPGIVQIYEVGLHAGLPYFALEYCEGGSLDDRLDGRPMNPRNAARVLSSVARAVHSAHQAGIVHRDLKPGNVLISRDGSPKVADFGLAKVAGSAASGATRSGAMLGTPAYMAPEQMDDFRAVGPAADVYALGAMLYEALTGRPPFIGESEANAIWLVMTQDPVPVRRLQPKVPVDLETVCHKCLAQEPARRYRSAAELADDLDRFVRGEPVRARPLGRLTRAGIWARRNPAVAALGAVCVLALGSLLIAGTVFAIDRDRAARDMAAKNEQLEAARRAAEDARIASETAGNAERLSREAAEQASRDEAQARRAAVESAARAVENFRSAEQAVGQFLAAIAEDRVLFSRDDLRPLREKLLRAVLEYSQSVRGQASGGELVMRTAIARTAYRTGTVLLKMGRTAEAVAALREAVEIAARAAAERPDRPDLAREAAGYRVNLGLTLWQSDDYPGAERELQTAAAAQQALAEAHPLDRDIRLDLVGTQGNLGAVLMRGRRDYAGAEQALRRALELCQDLVAADRENGLYWIRLVTTRSNLGSCLREAGRKADGEREFIAAFTVAERLAAGPVPDLEVLHLVATLSRNLALARHDAGDPAAAERLLRRNIELRRRLVDEQPSNPLHRTEMAQSRRELAELLQKAGEQAGAVRELRTALTEGERAAADFPGLSEFAWSTADTRMRLARLLSQAPTADDGAEIERMARSAAEAAASLAAAEPKNPRAPELREAAAYNLACVLVRLARSGGPKAAERLNAAIAALRQSQGRYADRAKTDADLDPLRGREDFRRLAAEWEAAGRK